MTCYKVWSAHPIALHVIGSPLDPHETKHYTLCDLNMPEQHILARILIMEDDATQAELLEAILSRAGHEVEVTYTGGEAWIMLQAKPFDVLLTDMRVPGPSDTRKSDGGLALIIRIRKAEGPNVPEWVENIRIIAISGVLPSASGQRVLDTASIFGADKCLQKPVSAQDLLDAIHPPL